MNGSKSYKVSIFGEIYSLVSDESEQHISEAANRVDGMMKEVAHATGVQDTKRLAVLVALRLMSSTLQNEVRIDGVVEHYREIAQKIDQFLV